MARVAVHPYRLHSGIGSAHVQEIEIAIHLISALRRFPDNPLLTENVVIAPRACQAIIPSRRGNAANAVPARRREA